ncbi:MAG: hypothetical protein AAF962_08305 [Actinomycetota bacterium]
MSVDTIGKGKNLSRYTKLEPADGVTILVTPQLTRRAQRIDVVTRKKLVGAKLIALVHLDACEI